MNRIIRNYATSSKEMFAQREFFGQQLTVHSPPSIVVIVRFASTITSCSRQWTVDRWQFKAISDTR